MPGLNVDLLINRVESTQRGSASYEINSDNFSRSGSHFELNQHDIDKLARAITSPLLITGFSLKQFSFTNTTFNDLFDKVLQPLSALKVFRIFPDCSELINSDHATKIVEIIQKNKIEILEINTTSIRDFGAIKIFRSLMTNQTLKTLHLVGCQLTEASTLAIADFLKINSVLVFLDVHGNSLGSRGVCEIAEALRFNRSLQRLCLDNTDAGATGVESILAMLDTNYKLVNVSVNTNNIPNHLISGMDNRMSEKLKRNTDQGKIIQDFVRVAREGDLLDLQALIDQHTDILLTDKPVVDENADTVLHIAVKHGLQNKVTYLLSLDPQKVELFKNAKSRDGKTPFDIACDCQYSEIASLLLAERVAARRRTTNGDGVEESKSESKTAESVSTSRFGRNIEPELMESDTSRLLDVIPSTSTTILLPTDSEIPNSFFEDSSEKVLKIEAKCEELLAQRSADREELEKVMREIEALKSRDGDRVAWLKTGAQKLEKQVQLRECQLKEMQTALEILKPKIKMDQMERYVVLIASPNVFEYITGFQTVTSNWFNGCKSASSGMVSIEAGQYATIAGSVLGLVNSFPGVTVVKQIIVAIDHIHQNRTRKRISAVASQVIEFEKMFRAVAHEAAILLEEKIATEQSQLKKREELEELWGNIVALIADPIGTLDDRTRGHSKAYEEGAQDAAVLMAQIETGETLVEARKLFHEKKDAYLDALLELRLNTRNNPNSVCCRLDNDMLKERLSRTPRASASSSHELPSTITTNGGNTNRFFNCFRKENTGDPISSQKCCVIS